VPAKSALPPFELTAPVSAKALPKGPQWVHEIEHAGRRSAAVIATALLGIRGHEAIIDGEIAGEGADRVLDSENLHRAIEASAHATLVYIAFDLLFLDGVDMRRWPLLSRKDALRDLLQPLAGTCIRFGDHVEGDGDRVRDRLAALGAEGVISKAATAPYRGGRDPSWLRVKLRADEDGRARRTEKWNLRKR
jgi:bifunctional non-homologous end joining protein LigD